MHLAPTSQYRQYADDGRALATVMQARGFNEDFAFRIRLAHWARVCSMRVHHMMLERHNTAGDARHQRDECHAG